MAIAAVKLRPALGLILLLTLLSTPAFAARQGSAGRPWHLVPTVAFSGFNSPVAVRHAGDERLFVVERAGIVRLIDGFGQVRPTPFLDIGHLVVSLDGERGLASLVFHPDYAANGAFFVLYTGGDGDSRVDRFRVSDDPDIADPTSRINLLTVAQPSPYHNGGDVQFGPDGFLYVSLGDGGPLPADPLNNGQNGATLLGSVLRLDVDQGTPYSVPADNPFVGDPAVRDEIWAIGLRNPWRFSFDRLTGDMYIGDVGEWMWEEVDFEPAGGPGGRNYGWRCFEGPAAFMPEACDGTAVTFPVYSYDHSKGCAVAGGHVYRGDDYPQLAGQYFLVDFCDGQTLTLEMVAGGWRASGVGFLGSALSSLDEDVAGELLAVGINTGRLYRFKPEPFAESIYIPLLSR